MEHLTRTMMELIASEVCGRAIDPSMPPLDEDAAARLYKLSAAHDMAHLTGSALLRRKLLPDGSARNAFEKQIMLSVYRCETQRRELSQLRDTLNAAGVPFLPLKGTVLRTLYPEPWMRTSCDIDILVPEERVDAAAQLLAAQLGYTVGDKDTHNVVLTAPGGVLLELHYRLLEDHCNATAAPLLDTVWDYADAPDGAFEHTLRDEMFYLYHIAHMSKHFLVGGCGIRPFLDLWLLEHRVSFDAARRDALLAQAGLLPFAVQARRLSEVWFGGAAHDDVTRELARYLLTGGVYGSRENLMHMRQLQLGGRARYLLSRIWMPYGDLLRKYPALEGRPALMPLYQLRRWGQLLLSSSATKRSLHELQLAASTTEESRARTRDLLETLGLEP